jgi:hypothetical protein
MGAFRGVPGPGGLKTATMTTNRRIARNKKSGSIMAIYSSGAVMMYPRAIQERPKEQV